DRPGRHATLQGYALRRSAAPARAQRWPPVHRPAAFCQKEMTAAIVRTADPVAAESARTTSAPGDLLADTRTRPRRQTQNADEARSIFLVIAFAHGERRKISAVERELRMPAPDADVALVKIQCDRS